VIVTGANVEHAEFGIGEVIGVFGDTATDEIFWGANRCRSTRTDRPADRERYGGAGQTGCKRCVILSFLRNSISIAKGGNHGISFTSAVGPQIARQRQNLLGGRNLLGDVLDDAIQRDASAAVRGVDHS
jgi:hypothetical protein